MGRSSIWGLVGAIYLESRWIRRQPQWLIQSALSTIGFLVLLYAWGGIQGIKLVIVGMIVASSWSIGVNIVAQTIGWSRISKTLYMYIVTPMKPITYLLGVLIASMIFLAVNIVAIAPVLVLLNLVNILLQALILGLCAMYVGLVLGLSIVMVLKNPVNISAITNPISWILTILPPTYYPLYVLPESIRVPALLSPTSCTAYIIRYTLGLDYGVDPVIAVCILMTWIAIVTILGAKYIRWGLD